MEENMTNTKKTLVFIMISLLIFNIIMIYKITYVNATSSYCTAANVVSCCKWSSSGHDCCPGEDKKSSCAGVVTNQHQVPYESVGCDDMYDMDDQAGGDLFFTGTRSSCHVAHLVYEGQGEYTVYECGGYWGSDCGIRSDYEPSPTEKVKEWQ
jgi:hypothetical protein